MASYDRQFEIKYPTLDLVYRQAITVADPLLVDPNSTSPLALIDGELVQFDTTQKWARATNVAAPSYFVIDERGDTTVQVSKRLSAVCGPSMFVDTVVFNTALTTLGASVGLGSVTLGGTRAGLVASGGNYILGYIVKVAATNGGKLQVHVTGL